MCVWGTEREIERERERERQRETEKGGESERDKGTVTLMPVSLEEGVGR